MIENDDPASSRINKALIKMQADDDFKRTLNDIIDASQTDESLNSIDRYRAAESIFTAHNSDLYYYPGTSEKAIELIKNTAEQLFPQEIAGNVDGICDLSIQSIYDGILKRMTNVETKKHRPDPVNVEEMCQQFNRHTNIVQEPRTLFQPKKTSHAHSTCRSVLLNLVNELDINQKEDKKNENNELVEGLEEIKLVEGPEEIKPVESPEEIKLVEGSEEIKPSSSFPTEHSEA